MTTPTENELAKYHAAQNDGATRISNYLSEGLFLKASDERQNMADREARMTERIGA